VLRALSVERERRCEVDSSGAGERGRPDSSSEFEGEVREEWERGFFEGLRGERLIIAGTRSRIGGRHVRRCRAGAALGALVTVNSCVLLGFPRDSRVLNQCIAHLHPQTVPFAARFQFPPFPSRVF
jgi:hypothetical protein